MLSVYKKELRSYFTTLTGYVAASLILVLTGIFIKIVAFDNKYMFIQNVLPSAAIILLIAIPIVTMSSFAGERAQKTDALLYSLPLSTAKIVIGKYLAMMTVFALPVAVISMIPAILKLYGTVDWFSFYSSVAMFALLVAAMTAICMFMSSLCESQVIAAVLGSGALIVCYFAEVMKSIFPDSKTSALFFFEILAIACGLIAYAFTKNRTVSLVVWGALFITVSAIHIYDNTIFLGIFAKAINLFALFDRFSAAVSAKVFDLNTSIYYLSIAVFFNVMTAQIVEKRRYS